MSIQSPSNLYPLTVGLLLGWLQTGLFFQLTFALSSGFTTYLLITLCWLLGSALGVYVVWRISISLRMLLLVMVVAYSLLSLLANNQPFNTQLSPVYGLLIITAGFYPGVFFARSRLFFSARMLFFWENNGFIAGMVSCTLLFMLLGSAVLWWSPLLIATSVWLMTREQNKSVQA